MDIFHVIVLRARRSRMFCNFCFHFIYSYSEWRSRVVSAQLGRCVTYTQYVRKQKHTHTASRLYHMHSSRSVRSLDRWHSEPRNCMQTLDELVLDGMATILPAIFIIINVAADIHSLMEKAGMNFMFLYVNRRCVVCHSPRNVARYPTPTSINVCITCMKICSYMVQLCPSVGPFIHRIKWILPPGSAIAISA